MTVPHSDPKPLEPWALELLQQERAAEDPDAQRELARLVALLRALPEPERSPDLAHRIVARVAEQESRPRVVHVLFGAARLLSRPNTAGLLAAGIAAVFAVALSGDSIPSVLRSATGTGISTNDGIEVIAAATHRSTIRRRAPVLIRPQFVSSVYAQTPAAALRFRPERAPMDEGFDVRARLDYQLNQLMIDPTAFAQRLERVAQRDQFIARLSERAAERGDAPEIALRVRESPHPLASQMMESLLRATLFTNVSQR
ncbi:MAG: hypothetical protein E6J87_03415 [Deltaproteobacteria bacterium]|nr:MAG: hypothetical protein E6J87_03415 [Deltaproteobacteria bacterium]